MNLSLWQGVATVPAGAGGNIAGTLVAGGVGATPKVVSAASSVTALRVVTPGGMSASQPSALRVTAVSSGVRSAGLDLCIVVSCRYQFVFAFEIFCRLR